MSVQSSVSHHEPAISSQKPETGIAADIPVTSFARPVEQALSVGSAAESGITVDIERNRIPKSTFKVSFPLLWKHWLRFWAGAGIVVFLSGLVLGTLPCILAVLLSLAAAFVLKSMDDHKNGKPSMVGAFLLGEKHNQVSNPNVQLAAAPPSPEHKKCPFCAEVIRFEAKLCRYCTRDLPVEVSSSLEPHSAVSAVNQPGVVSPVETPAAKAGGIAACAILLLLMIYLFGGGFLGSSPTRILPSAFKPPVPHVEVDSTVNNVAAHAIGVQVVFSDWQWDRGVLKGKVSLPASAPGPRQNSFWCTRYDKNGTKLDDAMLHGPGSISPGETAEVTVVALDTDGRTARIIIHSR